MKKFTPTKAKQKIRHYCAYQERSHREVKNKLFEYGLFSAEVDEILTELITEGFLSEERYAKAYVGGKFRIKKWGKIKIINALEGAGIGDNCIKIGLREISQEDYRQTLKELLEKKSTLIVEENFFEKGNKLAKYAIQKGYESELVWSLIKEVLPKD